MKVDIKVDKNVLETSVIIVTNQVNDEVLASSISMLIYGLLGLVFTISDQVWRKNEWSLLKRTVIPTLLAGWFLKWFPMNFLSIMIFIGTFTVIFVIIWVIIYLLIRREVRDINSKLKEKQKQ